MNSAQLEAIDPSPMIDVQIEEPTTQETSVLDADLSKPRYSVSTIAEKFKSLGKKKPLQVGILSFCILAAVILTILFSTNIFEMGKKTDDSAIKSDDTDPNSKVQESQPQVLKQLESSEEPQVSNSEEPQVSEKSQVVVRVDAVKRGQKRSTDDYEVAEGKHVQSKYWKKQREKKKQNEKQGNLSYGRKQRIDFGNKQNTWSRRRN